MRTIETDSPEDTERAGLDLGSRLRPGDLLLLRGPIGAGKTVLARGIGVALGVEDWRGSPTFTLVNEYRTDPPLYHVDLYRLAGSEAESIGLEEYIRHDSIVIMEWADRAASLLVDLAFRDPVWLDILHEHGHRIIVVHDPGRHVPPEPRHA